MTDSTRATDPASAAGPPKKVLPGDFAPAFTLADDTGADVSLESFRGRRVVLYFYPAAMTPGCTTQACDFRDNLDELTQAGVAVVGISPDSVQKLSEFRAAEKLTFTLLADPDHAVAQLYGAWGEKQNYGKSYVGLIRSTFVVDEQGRLEKVFNNVRAKGHVAKLRRELGI